ncbi:hypothetical protein LCGC14_1400360 [marine sediment metagenome]|uniref:Uncharacterized protein n=1 Tax=marine sediment metagenome TaxID=412755 RepID=A0A0F9KI72_9ZZZZ
MNSKYSMVKGPQGMPKVCKRQPPYCDDVAFPPPTVQALITFHGTSSIGSALEIVEVIRPRLETPPGDIWTQVISRPCYEILFFFETASLYAPLRAAFDVIEGDAPTVNVSYPLSPYQGMKRYDTLQRFMDISLGSGLATFRVTF